MTQEVVSVQLAAAVLVRHHSSIFCKWASVQVCQWMLAILQSMVHNTTTQADVGSLCLTADAQVGRSSWQKMKCEF